MTIFNVDVQNQNLNEVGSLVSEVNDVDRHFMLILSTFQSIHENTINMRQVRQRKDRLWRRIGSEEVVMRRGNLIVQPLL
jgi:hypothetical protein